MSKIGKTLTLRIPTGRELTFKEVDDNFELCAWTPITDKQYGKHPALPTEEAFVAHVLKRLDLIEAALGTGGGTTPTTYSATYVTTSADFTTKCGAGTSGDTQTASVDGYATKDGAEAAAKQAAIAKIVCPVVIKTYDNKIIGGETSKEVSLGAIAADTLEFDNFSGTDNSPLTLALWLGGTQVASIPYAAYYLGREYRFTHAGISYTKNFATGRVDL